MRQLHVVAVSEDGRHVVLATSKSASRGDFRVALDDRLAAAVRGDLPRPGETQPVVVTPKEIQARLRAGESPEEIAASAGVPVAKVDRYAGPVLSERERVLDQARAGFVSRSRLGPSALPLGEAVDRHLADTTGVRPETVSWSTRREESGSWLVELTYVSQARRRTAAWRYDVVRREVTPTDNNSAVLAHVEPSRRSRSHGEPVVPAPAAAAKSRSASRARRAAPVRPAAAPVRTITARPASAPVSAVTAGPAKAAPARRPAAQAPKTSKAAPAAAARAAQARAQAAQAEAARARAAEAEREAALAAAAERQAAEAAEAERQAAQAAAAQRKAEQAEAARQAKAAAAAAKREAKAAAQAAKEAAAKAAREAAEQAAREAAEQAARELAEQAAREVAEKAAREVAEKAAREAAEKAAREAAEAPAGPPTLRVVGADGSRSRARKEAPAAARTTTPRAAGQRASVPGWADVLLSTAPVARVDEPDPDGD